MSTIPPIPFPLRSDSYKVTHWRQYPPGTTEVYSYLESRGGRFPQTVFFGLQPYLRSYLAGSVVTAADVDTADRLAASHFGRHGISNQFCPPRILHADEEHDGRQCTDEPVQQRRPVLKLGWIITFRQRPREQRKDQKPGIIQTNGNPQDPA